MITYGDYLPLSETNIDGGYGKDVKILSKADAVSPAVFFRKGLVYAIREKQSIQTKIKRIPAFFR